MNKSAHNDGRCEQCTFFAVGKSLIENILISDQG